LSDFQSIKSDLTKDRDSKPTRTPQRRRPIREKIGSAQACSCDATVGANNYIQNLNKTYLPPFSLKISTDLITLTLDRDIKPNLSRILSEIGFKGSNGGWAKGKTYRHIWQFKSEECGISIDLLYNATKPFYPRNQLTIHDPDREFLELVGVVFKSLDVLPKISCIELAFDFYTVDSSELLYLEDFIKNHLFLRYQRKPSFKYKGTYYTTNLRQAAKGTRLYAKRIGEELALRLELVLHRTVVGDLGLEWPLEDIDSLIDLNRFFDFRVLDEARLGNYLVKQCKQYLRDSTKEADHQDADAIGRTIRAALLSGEDALMARLERLRRSPQISTYHRFLCPMNDFNRDFSEAVARQPFIPRAGKHGKPLG